MADAQFMVYPPTTSPKMLSHGEAPIPLGMIQLYDNKDKYRIKFPDTAALSEKLGLLVRIY